MLVLSAGCCGGSTPMCFPERRVPRRQPGRPVGTVADCEVYLDRRQLAAWPHAEVVIDVEPGSPDGFSLGAGDGRHFVCWASSEPLARGAQDD